MGFEGTHTPRFCSTVQREEVWLTINDHPKAGGLFSSSTRFKQERLDYNLLRSPQLFAVLGDTTTTAM